MTERDAGDVLLDVARGLYVVGVLAAAAVSGGFDFLLLLSAVAAVGVRWLPVTRTNQLAVVAALLITGLSSGFRLYGWFGFYDKLVHGLFFALVTPTLYRLAVRSKVAVATGSGRDAVPAARLSVVLVALALTGGAVWEIFEWVSDTLAGTTFQRGNADTMGDLVADATGGLVAALIWGRAATGGGTRPSGMLGDRNRR